VIEKSQVFGRLTVLNPGLCARDRSLCRCVCGRELYVINYNLKGGNTKSCGCLSKELVVKRNLSHGRSKTSTYRVWAHMLARCRNEKSKDYPDYGGRGITVDHRWDDFSAFLADMGERPSAGHSIDRIRNAGNYEPGNCRWATPKEQARNTRSCQPIELNGISRTVAEWAEIMGYKRPAVIHTRIYRGWSIQDAILGRGQAA
jgi:hypothetical protein